MKTRSEIVSFAQRQLNGDAAQKPGGKHHYGKWELQKLMDFIFGGPPQKDEEKFIEDPAMKTYFHTLTKKDN